MSNFFKRTKRASEEIAYDAMHSKMASSDLISDGTFIEWLHQVTVLGYERNIVLGRTQAQLIEYLYKKGESPAEAIDSIEDVLKRVDAINANPE